MKDKDCKGCKCTCMSSWVMRIVLAVIFIFASYGKIAVMGIDGFSEMFGLPVIVGWLVALGEMGAGIGIILGKFIHKMDPKSWLTRLSGGTIALIMLGAIFIAKLKGFEAGFAAGFQGMQVDLALFALGFHFLAAGNACATCTICCENK